MHPVRALFISLVKIKIREEIQQQLHIKEDEKHQVFQQIKIKN